MFCSPVLAPDINGLNPEHQLKIHQLANLKNKSLKIVIDENKEYRVLSGTHIDRRSYLCFVHGMHTNTHMLIHVS
jgi:hypothetical protein